MSPIERRSTRAGSGLDQANITSALVLIAALGTVGLVLGIAGGIATHVRPGENGKNGHWTDALRRAPTVWERFRLVPA